MVQSAFHNVFPLNHFLDILDKLLPFLVDDCLRNLFNALIVQAFLLGLLLLRLLELLELLIGVLLREFLHSWRGGLLVAAQRSLRDGIRNLLLGIPFGLEILRNLVVVVA